MQQGGLSHCGFALLFEMEMADFLWFRRAYLKNRVRSGSNFIF